jgi:Ca2+-binding RTX toxin-like protein
MIISHDIRGWSLSRTWTALNGVSERDVIGGGESNDRIASFSGYDELWGDLGRDILTGGAGLDGINCRHLNESKTLSSARDTTTDFQHGQDDIDLHKIDAKAGAAGHTFKCIGTQAFLHVKGALRIWDTGANHIVEGDVDGDGRADIAILVLGAAKMSAGDVIL